MYILFLLKQCNHWSFFVQICLTQLQMFSCLFETWDFWGANFSMLNKTYGAKWMKQFTYTICKYTHNNQLQSLQYLRVVNIATSQAFMTSRKSTFNWSSNQTIKSSLKILIWSLTGTITRCVVSPRMPPEATKISNTKFSITIVW